MESSCPLENGQQNSSCLYPEDGRDLVCAHVAGDTGNLEVCARQGNNAVCGILTGLPEHRGRLAVQELSGQQRLAVEEKLPSCSQNIHGEGALPLLTTAAGDNGVAGVMRGKLIHFVPLWLT